MSLGLICGRTWDVLFLWQHLPADFADMLRQCLTVFLQVASNPAYDSLSSTTYICVMFPPDAKVVTIQCSLSNQPETVFNENRTRPFTSKAPKPACPCKTQASRTIMSSLFQPPRYHHIANRDSKKIPIDADSKMRTLSNWSQITSKRLVIRNCLKAFKNRRRRLILHPQKLKRYVGKSNDSFQNFVNKGIHRPGSGISFTKLVSEK